MNPFNLYGPQFLIFYTGLGISILLVIYLLWFNRDSDYPDSIVTSKTTSDPYKIAYLRGGANEALRVASISLVDRGILKIEDNDFIVTDKKADPSQVTRQIEKDLVAHFKTKNKATSIFTAPRLKESCLSYQTSLGKEGLIPDSSQRAFKYLLGTGAYLTLIGTSIIKIGVAFSRGRYNVMFLVMLTTFFCGFLYFLLMRRQTKKGASFLSSLRIAFRSLNDKSDSILPGGATNEISILAAVFGLSAVDAVSYPYVKTLFPKASTSSSSGSCGSSCGSSCGGGGGGGCGGGCGGCGG